MYLLADPRVDPSAENNSAIISACVNGHTKIVELLLHDPRVDPSANDNCPITWASKEGHTEIVNLLLSKMTPFDKLKYAMKEKNIDMIKKYAKEL